LELETAMNKNLATVLSDVEGFLLKSEEALLYRLAKMAVLPIVEIGSYKGRSTICLAFGSSEGNNVKVHAIDPHTGAEIERVLFGGGSPLWTFDVFKKNIKNVGLEHLVVAHVQTSQEAAKEWKGGIGVVWIDGDHSYEMSLLDFRLWGTLLSEGGLIAFHDSTNPFFGVEKMLLEHLFPDKRFSKFGLRDGIVYAYKVNDPLIVRAFYVFRLKFIMFWVRILRRMPIPTKAKFGLKKIYRKVLYR